MDLSGKTAAVVGGSGDIGSGIAMRLARLGADISLAGRTAAKLAAVANRIREETGRTVRSFQHDLRQPGQADAFVQETVSAFGGLDIVVTCAGDFKRGDLTSISHEDWQDGFGLMFFAAASVVRASWPQLKTRKGSIVMVSGLHGLEPHAESIMGGPICAAIINFAKGASQQGKRDGVSVNCIVPGWIYGRRLEMSVDKLAKEQGIDHEEAMERIREKIGLTRFGTPDDIANVVELLVSEKGQYFQGASIVLDGGLKTSA